ncbi:MAG TPA: fatty acid desaturase [Gemmataceae bacterium]
MAPREVMTPDELLRRVNGLRRTDNFRNWFYLLREYLFLGLVAGLTIAFYYWLFVHKLSWLYAAPVSVLAVLLIGAGQHRLTTLAHEASHYLLFRNRLLNELASDWFCLFPMWSTTHHYRLQHLAHHQFPNDPQRDPDVLQMEGSGHRFPFPMSPGRFVWQCVVKQGLWLPGLIRYIRMRAKYASTGSGSGPYSVVNPRTQLIILAGACYTAVLAIVLAALVVWGDLWRLALVPAAMGCAAVLVYTLIPQRFYSSSRLKPDVSIRWTSCGRVAYITILFTALAWLHRLTGEPWELYYLVLWLVPIGTSFAFCMIARQVVQHGNAGGDRFGNTRVFLVGRLIRWAVFPLGMDYHLPHHLFPLVPHYRLPQLHALLLTHYPEYRRHCTIVEGYFFHRRPPEHTTVLEMMAQPQMTR